MRDAIDMDERVTERSWHLWVHLGDHKIGRVDGRAHDVDRDAEATVAVVVRRAHLDEGHVDAHPSRRDKARDLREEYRHEVCAALLDGAAYVGSDEEGCMPEAPLEPRR